MAILYPTRIKKTNLGDILINVLLIRELSKHSKVYLDGCSEELLELIKYNNPHHENIRYIRGLSFFDGLPVLRWLKMSHKLAELDLVFDPPGHYLQESELKSKAKLLKYWMRARILHLFDIGVARIGVTMGPFSPKLWQTTSKLSILYRTIGIRDKSNLKLLESKGFKNLSFIDDISFLYQNSDFKTTPLKELDGKEYVIFSFRGAIAGKNNDKDYLKNLIPSLRSLISDFLSGKNYNIILSYQVEEDLQVIRLIKENIEDLGVECQLIEKQLTLPEIATLYSSARYIFTNRLHVALLGLLNGTVAVGITDVEKHHKLCDLFTDIGQQQLLLDINNFKADHLDHENFENGVLENFEKVRSAKRQLLENQIKDIVLNLDWK